MFYMAGEQVKDTLAEIVYSVEQPDRLIIQHTFVSDELRGKNIGYELVNEVVKYARKKTLRLLQYVHLRLPCSSEKKSLQMC
ncbi:MAG: hypothetical protein C4329_09995 [Chitinophagaceae bacterium]